MNCKCVVAGSKTTQCDLQSGDCDCKDNIDGKTCNKCVDQFFGFPSCKRMFTNHYFFFIIIILIAACNCEPVGTKKNTTCDLRSGKCQCNEGYTGEKCDQCAAGFFSAEPAKKTCAGKIAM